MGEAEHRKLAGGPSERSSSGSLAEMIKAFADSLLADAGQVPHVLVSPVVWRPDKGKKVWYFSVVSGRGENFWLDQVVAGEDQAIADEARAALYAELLQRRPIVVHDFDDELEMAKCAEALWPSDKVTDIRVSIEAERRISR